MMGNWLWVGVIVVLFAIVGLGLFLGPARLLRQLIVKSLLGLVILVAANYLGGLIAFTLPVNPVTVLITGFLGLPGLGLLAYLKLVAIA